MQTVTPETAKRLKMAGFPQNCIYFNGEAAAPTAEEMLEQLPAGLAVGKNNSGYSGCLLNESWRDVLGLGNRNLWEHTMALTAAEAAAKMWLYLKENNLI